MLAEKLPSKIRLLKGKTFLDILNFCLYNKFSKENEL